MVTPTPVGPYNPYLVPTPASWPHQPLTAPPLQIQLSAVRSLQESMRAELVKSAIEKAQLVIQLKHVSQMAQSAVDECARLRSDLARTPMAAPAVPISSVRLDLDKCRTSVNHQATAISTMQIAQNAARENHVALAQRVLVLELEHFCGRCEDPIKELVCQACAERQHHRWASDTHGFVSASSRGR